MNRKSGTKKMNYQSLEIKLNITDRKEFFWMYNFSNKRYLCGYLTKYLEQSRCIFSFGNSSLKAIFDIH